MLREPMRKILSVLVLGICLGLAAQTPMADAEPVERSKIETIVREYLLENPEVIEKALEELQRRTHAKQEKARSAALAAEKDALLRSENDIVLGNASGDVTLIEFFDFNCGYCKRAAPDVVALVAADPKLRVVLKDFPILGPGSVEASKVALAVKQLKGSEAAGEFHKRLIVLPEQVDGARALQLVQELGWDRKAIEAEAASQRIEAIISATMDLAQRLGMTGTPAFIVGDQVIEGAVGQGPLKDAIQAARK